MAKAADKKPGQFDRFPPKDDKDDKAKKSKKGGKPLFGKAPKKGKR